MTRSTTSCRLPRAASPVVPVRVHTPPAAPPPARWCVDRLAALLRDRQGAAAAAYYLRAAGSPFGPLFNAAAGRFDGAAAAARLLDRTARVLERMVDDGDLPGTSDFLRFAPGLVRMSGTHERVLEYHKAHPRLPPDGTLDRFGDPVRRPLFASRVDPAGVAGRATDPAMLAEYPELLAAVRRAARGVGRLHVRAEHLYRRFEFATGSGHGAYRYLAAMAVTAPDTGRVVGFRPWRAAPAPVPPPRAVYRQVRRIHAEGRDRVRAAARRLGVEVPPGY